MFSELVASWAAWLKRTLLNACSLAFFPVVRQTTTGVYWIGLGYWVFGVANLLSLISAGYLAVRRGAVQADARLSFFTTFWLSTWLMLSVSMYVQPRYMMVTLPIGIGILSALAVRARVIAMLLAAAAVASFMASSCVRGNCWPAVSPDTFWVNPYQF